MDLLVNGQIQALGHFEEEIGCEAHEIGLSADLQAMAQGKLPVHYRNRTLPLSLLAGYCGAELSRYLHL